MGTQTFKADFFFSGWGQTDTHTTGLECPNAKSTQVLVSQSIEENTCVRCLAVEMNAEPYGWDAIFFRQSRLAYCGRLRIKSDFLIQFRLPHVGGHSVGF